MLEVGQSTPALELADADVILISFANCQELRSVVLYEYPEDYTPGCTNSLSDLGVRSRSERAREEARSTRSVVVFDKQGVLRHAS